MEAALTGVAGEQRPTPSRRVSAWIAAAVVLMLVVSGLYLNTIRPNNGGEQRLAWAPATPRSTPVIIGDFSCTADPLTNEQVLAITLNPQNESNKLQELPDEMNMSGLMEYGRPRSDQLWNSDILGPINDGEAMTEIVDTANTFWECVAVGSARQVWSFMTPETLQYEILRYLPVVRTQQDIENKIAELADQPYRSVDAFFGFGGYQDLNDGMFVASPAQGIIRINGDASWDTRSAIVQMFPITRPASSYIEILLQEYPNGEWRVVDMRSPTARG